MKGDDRARRERLKVFVNDEERARIAERAEAAGLSLSAFLKAAAVGARFRNPRVNLEVVRALAAVNRDQARLGNLLKLALSEPGLVGRSADVERLIRQIRSAQERLAEAVQRL